YHDMLNILWVEGGDHTPSTGGNPSEMDLVNAIAAGIKEGDAGAHFHTGHWSSETLGSDVPPATWLDVDSVYTYQPAYLSSLTAFNADHGKRPFFLIESSYENEHGSSPSLLRSEMIQPLIAGGAGFIFGNFPMWAFWKPGADPWQFDDGAYPGGWSTALDSPGAHSATAVGTIFRPLAWNGLAPDVAHKVLTSGFGNGDVLLESAADGSLAVVYFSGNTKGTIDLGKLKAPLAGRWFDPSSAASQAAQGSPFSGGQ